MGEAIDRAQRDADELAEGFCRLQNQGLLHSTFDAYRTAAENLVTEGWTRMRPGEKLIGPADAALLNEVQCAYIRWEALKKKVHESAEVRRDESQRTSDVKSASDEALILAAFAGANTPLYFDEAASAAAGHRVTTHAPESWDRWTNAFRSLVEGGYLETLPAGEGEVRRYQLTDAGRVWKQNTVKLQAKILAAFGSCEGPMSPSRHEAIATAAEVEEVGELKEADYQRWISAFTELVEARMLEAEPCVSGKVRRYTLTGAGVEALDTSIEMAKWKCWP